MIVSRAPGGNPPAHLDGGAVGGVVGGGVASPEVQHPPTRHLRVVNVRSVNRRFVNARLVNCRRARLVNARARRGPLVVERAVRLGGHQAATSSATPGWTRDPETSRSRPRRWCTGSSLVSGVAS